MKEAATILLLSLLAFFAASIDGHSFDNAEAGRNAAASVGRPVGRHLLIDQLGRRFAFPFEGAQDKAVVVNFIYTDCGHVCPLIVGRLADAFKKAGADFGERFTALTVGLDTEKDTPEHMADYGSRVAAEPAKWRFASADAKTIAALTKELGIYYKKTVYGFDHANIVTIVGPDKRVFSQVYGPAPSPDEILRPLYDSLKPRSGDAADNAGKPLSLLDRLRLLCYTYDPATGEYRADYGFFAVIGIGVFVLGALVFLVRHIIHGARPADKGVGS